METGQTYEIIEEHQPLGQEKTIVQVVKTPLYGADGSIIGLQGIFWDITAQKLAEEQIRRANAELARSREELRTKNLLMEENLHMAREIQFAMLPQQYPAFPRNVPAEQSAFQFVHRYQPAETVSGDFFSVSALSDTEAAVFICDVTGHGIRAALVTAMIRALAEELKPLARDPGMFLRKLNSDLCSILKTTGSPMLTTAFYLVADWQTGVMRFANAGHPKPLLVRRATGQVEPLANAAGRSQPALGLFDDPPYQTTEITIAARRLRDAVHRRPLRSAGAERGIVFAGTDDAGRGKPAAQTHRGIVRRTAGSHPRVLRGPRIRRRRLPRRHGIHGKTRLKS